MEIVGVGLDILEIERMEKNVENPLFMERVFTKSERDYILSKGKMAPSSAAGIFCAKEAFTKALGEGLKIPLSNLEVCHDSRGKPFFALYDSTSTDYASYSFQLSITHNRTTAAAMVVAAKI